jgi:mRNA interferase HicA
MKRRDLLRHMTQHGCRFVREGGEHSIWENPATNRRTSVPRHREVPAQQQESANNWGFLCLPESHRSGETLMSVFQGTVLPE